MKPFPSGTRLKFLLADDDEDDRILFGQALQEVDREAILETVHNGRDLMRKLRSSTSSLPDMVLLDLNMPGMTGLQCLEEIRSDEAFEHVPVLMYSTTSEMTAVQASYKLGANYYLRKPADFEGLTAAIRKLLTIDNASIQPPKEKFVIYY